MVSLGPVNSGDCNPFDSKDASLEQRHMEMQKIFAQAMLDIGLSCAQIQKDSHPNEKFQREVTQPLNELLPKTLRSRSEGIKYQRIEQYMHAAFGKECIHTMKQELGKDAFKMLLEEVANSYPDGFFAALPMNSPERRQKIKQLVANGFSQIQNMKTQVLKNRIDILAHKINQLKEVSKGVDGFQKTNPRRDVHKTEQPQVSQASPKQEPFPEPGMQKDSQGNNIPDPNEPFKPIRPRSNVRTSAELNKHKKNK